MDAATYGALQKKIAEVEEQVDGLAAGFDYKGSVAAVADLPGSPAAGDMYTVTGANNARYVYDGTQWINLDAELFDLEDELSDLKSEINQVVNANSGTEVKQAFVYDDAVVDITLNGVATSLFDGTVVIDGVNVKVNSLNGQTTNENRFMVTSGINKANGSDFVSDTLPPASLSSTEYIVGRSNNQSVEISLSKTRCEYTVEAANTYLQSHPIRIWFKTPDYATASTFYYCINAAKTGFYLNIGTLQAISPLSNGDFISFNSGEYKSGATTGTVGISGKLEEIADGATVSSTGNLTVKTLIDLGSALAEKVQKDGWNEVPPINTTFFDGVNYFDIEKATVYNDRFVNGDGKIVGDSGGTTIVFPVKPDTIYWFFTSGMNRFYVVENSTDYFAINSTYTVLHNSSETTPTTFTTGHTAKYVCAYIANYNYDFTQNTPVLNEKLYNGANNPYVSQGFLPEDVINPIRGANVLIFGDSITDTCNITINESDETTAYSWKNPSNSYVDSGGTTITFSMWAKMLNDLGICGEIRNYAFSGASYQDAERTAGNERQNLSYQITVALNDLDNPNNVFDVDNFVPDIVIFALGTNDGDPDDTYADAMAKTVLKSDGYSIDTTATLANLDTSKFCEAARKAFLRTRIAFPYAQFYCVLPIQKANDETNGEDLNTDLRHMARRYGCVIIDGFAESGIIRDTNVWNGLGTTLKDGLHPNDKGQNMMFRMIYSALKSHYIKNSVMNAE